MTKVVRISAGGNCAGEKPLADCDATRRSMVEASKLLINPDLNSTLRMAGDKWSYAPAVEVECAECDHRCGTEFGILPVPFEDLLTGPFIANDEVEFWYDPTDQDPGSITRVIHLND